MECREGEKVGFSEGLEQIDSAVKTMSSMLNRFNHATIFIGVDKTGRPLGRTFSEDDFPIIEAKIREKLNRMPKYSTEIGSQGSGNYIIVKAEGYETPYAFEGWFYGRKRCPVRKGDTVEVGWTETLTCGMKRH